MSVRCKHHCHQQPVAAAANAQPTQCRRSADAADAADALTAFTTLIVTIIVCEPQQQNAQDCVARRSNVFNYMRVIPLQREASAAADADSNDVVDDPNEISPATTPVIAP